MVNKSHVEKEFFKEMEKPRLDALKRIRAEILIEPQQPDEFTAQEVAEELGIGTKTAIYRLNKLVNEGKMTTRKGHNRSGYNARLYKWIEGKQ
jgi:predicted ArsR family transcriptional regulator